MSRRRVQRWGMATVVTIGVVLLGPPSVAATAPNDVSLGFNSGTANARISSVTNSGTAPTRQRIVTANGGYLTARTSRTGGLAAEFPVFNGAPNGPRAVVAVTNSGTVDRLNPGALRFVFGADVRRDSVSVGTPSDNGNNIIQRGLSDDAAQYKLQLDDGFASCRVKGSQGNLYVTSTLRLQPDTWYRVWCVRAIWAAGDHLMLNAAPINADGTIGSTTGTASGVGPVGSTPFAFGTPLSVGGKLNSNLTINTASDQFNGRIDNAYFRVT